MIGGMSTVVYVDVLLFINTILTYAVLITAERLLKRESRLWRLITAAFIGSLFSLLLFFGIDSFFFTLLIKIVSSLVITLTAFPFSGKKEFLKTVLGVIAVSVVYGGAFILIYQLFKPPNMIIMNDVVYFEFNPLVLLGATAVIYLLITLFEKLFRERIKNSVVRVKITVGEQEIACVGKIDTGCNLTEPFSGAPVIIVDAGLVAPDEGAELRVIPYSTLAHSSLLYAFKAEHVVIGDRPVERTVYIAAAPMPDRTVQAIINSDIVR